MPKASPKGPAHHTAPHDPAQPDVALPEPSEAGLKPAEYGQYGMRTEHEGGHGSDHGAASDHASFDAEFSTREARNHQARTIPTGLSDAPPLSTEPADGASPLPDHGPSSPGAPARKPPAKS